MSFEEEKKSLSPERKEIPGDLIRIFKRAYEINGSETYEKILAKSEELVKKYGEEVLMRCILYHFLIGSSLLGENSDSVFDVNGEIEQFIREELPKE